MGTLYLVRHGQASFGADDYDRLSELGEKQAQQLGVFWQERGQRFDAVYRGTLRRHVQTLDGIASALDSVSSLPVQARRALNEYDSAALLRAVHPDPLPRADTPELFRLHFRLLCDALSGWMQGRIQPEGMPDWPTFSGGIHEVLDEIRQRHVGQNVLLVSSGGPISTAVGHILGAAAEVAIGLNMRLHNSAVSEFSISSKRLMLKSFNNLQHLSAISFQNWVTLA